MTKLNFLALGSRVALSGRRNALARVALMSGGIAIAVAMLLGAMTARHAVLSRQARADARAPSSYLERADRPPSNSLLMWEHRTEFGKHPLLFLALKPIGAAPVPPGLPRLPRRGEAFVSPAIGALLESSSGSLLEPRLRARPVGTIAPAGLLDPRELVAYTGAPSRVKRVLNPGVFTGGYRHESVNPRIGYYFLIGLTVLAFLLPIGLFVVTATRLSTATREARLAAIRLAGATQAQVRFIISIEAAIVAGAGTAVGTLIFLIGRQAAIAAMRDDRFASDLTLPIVAFILVIVVVPLFVLVVALAGSRNLVVSPLGIVRPARRQRRGERWAVIGGVGIGLLLISALVRDWVLGLPSPLPGVVVCAGVLLVMIGLVGSAQWCGWAMARAIGRRTAALSVLLGTRRLESEPSSAGRVVTGIALLVALVGLGQAIVLAYERDATKPGGGQASWIMDLDKETVIASVYIGDNRILKSLSEIPGVRSVDLTRRVPNGGISEGRFTAVVHTDGRASTLEEVRNSLAWVGTAETVEDLRAGAPPSATAAGKLSSGAELLSLLVVLITAASLLVSTVDAMLERRRPLAALSAIGASPGLLRRSLLTQVGVPLLGALALGVVVSVILVVLIFRLLRVPLFLPLVQLGQIVLAAGVAVMLVTLIALPWTRVSRRPDLLRAE